MITVTFCFYFPDCTVDGDPRGTPNKMNSEAGHYLNIFKEMTFSENGYVTRFQYYAYTNGEMFVSFWYRQGGDHTYKMRGKIKFTTKQGSQVRIVTLIVYIIISFSHVWRIHNRVVLGLLIIYYMHGDCFAKETHEMKKKP